MSTTEIALPSTARLAAPRLAAPSSTTFSQDDCPTEVLPVVAPAAPVPAPARRSILHSAASAPAPFAGWRDATPTEALPAVSSSSSSSSSPRRRDRPARRPSHLRAALSGLLIAVALLIPMQLFAAHGISSARQAASAARSDRASRTQPEQASPVASPATTLSGQSTHSEQGAPSALSGQSPAQPEWVTEHTGAAYDRTNPHASPLTLPRCTASPDTPLPCLATISPSQSRAVVLEEDASLTALVRR